MSLEILKERFNVKHPTSETEIELEQKRKLVEELQNESVNLKNQLSLLENENENLISEVNKFRKDEESMVLLKEEEFNNKLQNKDLHITNLKLDIDSLYEQMGRKDRKIDYKNNMINESLDAVREAKVRIDNLKNELKLNENKSSKITKKLELQIEENYNEYMYNLKSLQNSVMDNNKVIDDKKQKLENSLKEIKKLTKNIDILEKKNKKDEKRIKELNNKIRESSNSFILENNTFKKKLSEKDEHIYKLRTEVEDLTDKLRLIDNMRYKNEEFDENSPNVQSLIELLKGVSKEKQKMQIMDWNQWKEIPENRYLIELSMKAAEETFKDNNFNKLSFTDQSKFRSSTHLGRRKGGDRIVSAKKELGGFKSIALKEANEERIIAMNDVVTTLNNEALSFRIGPWSEDQTKITNDDNDFLSHYRATGTYTDADTDDGVTVSGTYTAQPMDSAHLYSTFHSASQWGRSGEYVPDNVAEAVYSGKMDGMSGVDASSKYTLIKTDSQGIDYFAHLENDISSTSDDMGINLVSQGTWFYASTASDVFPANHFRSKIINYQDASNALCKKTYVFVMNVPETTLNSETNMPRGTYSEEDHKAMYYWERKASPHSWSLSIGIWSQNDSNYLKGYVDMNPDKINNGTAVSSGTKAYTENTISLDEKFVLFVEIDRVAGTIKMALNDDDYLSTSIIDNANHTWPWITTHNHTDTPNIQMSAWGANTPEWHQYDIKIYDKNLSDTERSNVYDQYKEYFGV